MKSVTVNKMSYSIESTGWLYMQACGLSSQHFSVSHRSLLRNAVGDSCYNKTTPASVLIQKTERKTVHFSLSLSFLTDDPRVPV